MSEHHIERFFEKRFGKKPASDTTYFKEWKGRLTGLQSITEISSAMDSESRIVWGKVTGQKIGYIELMGWEGPVYQLVDLKTGLDIGDSVNGAQK